MAERQNVLSNLQLLQSGCLKGYTAFGCKIKEFKLATNGSYAGAVEFQLNGQSRLFQFLLDRFNTPQQQIVLWRNDQPDLPAITGMVGKLFDESVSGKQIILFSCIITVMQKVKQLEGKEIMITTTMPPINKQIYNELVQLLCS